MLADLEIIEEELLTEVDSSAKGGQDLDGLNVAQDLVCGNHDGGCLVIV